ncbi:hypothetical protein [Sporosarcina gallistercoris]|uniref:Uncharacterized protein n=1 Tax=Sporosarcina gallistercoris TaxID=2762245 RepID=A0ABR8PLR1_9BACL|nr:hypothetical protein [Sporosarcina gallistercoris]MBD7909113.1 hypothetical protein [Sporosarcina gallistercoris]
MALRKSKLPRVTPNQSTVENTIDVSSTTAHVKEPVEGSKTFTQTESSKIVNPLVEQHPVKKIGVLKELEEILPTNTFSTKGAALSIVNNKNGKRVKVATPILNALDSPNAVRFLVNDENQEVYIVAAQAEEVAHNLAGKPTKNVVYSAGLVERLTSLFELDYSSRTSHSIGTWTVIEEEGTRMICVRLAKEIQEERYEELEDEHAVPKQVTEPVSEMVSESSAS